MYTCECGYTSITKLGKCPNCGQFGKFREVEESNDKKTKSSTPRVKVSTTEEEVFFPVGNSEVRRLFPKGIKKGGTYLLAGEPGIGKSTILAQLVDVGARVGYFSGEESPTQVHARLKRIGVHSSFDVFFVTDIESIDGEYDIIIVDSIQTIGIGNETIGSSSSVKQISQYLNTFAKKTGAAIFIIGHITKLGDIAGPKYLEHIVDVVLYLEGDSYGDYRFLRCKKNRYGSSSETAIFEMTQEGLKATSTIPLVGSGVKSIGLDNGRPIICSIEVLLNKSYDKFPKRVVSGVDYKRVDLVVAILEKYLGVKLGQYDIFVNIPGQLQFSDNGLDLGIAVGIYSQYSNKKTPDEAFIGELGLGGDVLKTKLHEKRVGESSSVIDYRIIPKVRKLKDIIG